MSGASVSILIASHNTGHFLPETLASALDQTHRECEVILVDDGSDDDTAERIAPFRDRIRYVRQAHAGLASARNHGLRFARGDYLALLDADDLWAPTKLAVQVAIAGRFPQCGLIFCDGVEFEGGEVTVPHLLRADLLQALEASTRPAMVMQLHRAMMTGSLIACPAQTLIPRAVVEQVGRFQGWGAQDYDYWLRIARRYLVAAHRDLLVRWRYHGESMSGPRGGRKVKGTLHALPVLGAHLQRCDGAEDRQALLEEIDRRTRWLLSAED